MKCAFNDGPCYYKGVDNECTRGNNPCLYPYRHPEKMPQKQKNNEQIDNASYYKLPCGKYLEDYIYYKGLSFAEGSALKYRWRAGHKDGESIEKDNAKCKHFCTFLAIKEVVDVESVIAEVEGWYAEAMAWDGSVTGCL